MKRLQTGNDDDDGDHGSKFVVCNTSSPLHRQVIELRVRLKLQGLGLSWPEKCSTED